MCTCRLLSTWQKESDAMDQSNSSKLTRVPKNLRAAMFIFFLHLVQYIARATGVSTTIKSSATTTCQVSFSTPPTILTCSTEIVILVAMDKTIEDIKKHHNSHFLKRVVNSLALFLM